MLKHRIRTTALAATALVAALSLTACQDTTDSGAGTTSGTGATSVTGAASNTGATSGASAENAAAETSKGSDSKGSAAESGKSGSAAGESTASGSNAASGGNGSGNAGSADGSSGSGDKSGYGQVCGANDISWSTRAETQAGGYILIIAKARSGITCVLPAALPTVAFGSDGTEAGPAEQAVGPQITLKRGVTAYAGVNPKTTNDNWGKELNSIIVAIGNEDPNPVSLPVGKILVAEPIVTNWHTSAADAVPFSS
ncbi:hypothetical protein [Streptomyces sp. NBC_00872]|uniref:hypothetical protein n=1 Tax=Streptomyces sp. NBC_00872 TaxID=2903686 RepID=UPI00386FC57E|nr:DUF4232 domain-containing protein [Streptomyces sp. NBC_00872]